MIDGSPEAYGLNLLSWARQKYESISSVDLEVVYRLHNQAQYGPTYRRVQQSVRALLSYDYSAVHKSLNYVFVLKTSVFKFFRPPCVAGVVVDECCQRFYFVRRIAAAARRDGRGRRAGAAASGGDGVHVPDVPEGVRAAARLPDAREDARPFQVARVSGVWQTVPAARPPEEAHARAHARTAVRVRRVPEAVHARQVAEGPRGQEARGGGRREPAAVAAGRVPVSRVPRHVPPPRPDGDARAVRPPAAGRQARVSGVHDEVPEPDQPDGAPAHQALPAAPGARAAVPGVRRLVPARGPSVPGAGRVAVAAGLRRVRRVLFGRGPARLPVHRLPDRRRVPRPAPAAARLDRGPPIQRPRLVRRCRGRLGRQ